MDLVTVILILLSLLLGQPLPTDIFSLPEEMPTATSAPQPQVLAATSDRIQAQVLRVVDGDTIHVQVDGLTKKIRIIGLDTPETVDPRTTVECYGREASDKAKELLKDESVWLESDSSQGDKDRYGRLLRYVWFDDQRQDFGLTMIEQGFGSEYTYDQPYRYQTEYKKAEIRAQQAGLGLWNQFLCPSTEK